MEVVERRNDGSVIVRHPQLGKFELKGDQLRPDAQSDQRVRPSLGVADALGTGRPSDSGDEQREPTNDEDGEEKKQPWFDINSGLFGTPLLRGWDNSFGLGLSGSQGGFEDTKLSILFSTGIENEHRRWIVDSFYFLNITPQRDGQDERISKNQANALLRRDWMRTEEKSWDRLFGFLQSRYRFNGFQPWKNRIAAQVGPGYEVLKGRKTKWLGTWSLDLRAGLGGSYIWGRDTTNQGQPEALAAFKLGWHITELDKFTTENEFFFDISGGDDHRTVQNLSAEFDIGQPRGLGIRFSFLYNFDRVSSGKENDLTYLSSLTWDF